MFDYEDDGYAKPGQPDLEEGWKEIWTRGYVDGLPEVREEFRGKLHLSGLYAFVARIAGFAIDRELIGKEMPPDLLDQFTRTAVKRARFDGVIRVLTRVEIEEQELDDADLEWVDEPVDESINPINLTFSGFIELTHCAYILDDLAGNTDDLALNRDKMFLLDAAKSWMGDQVKLTPKEYTAEFTGDSIPIQFLRHVCVEPPGTENLWRDYVYEQRKKRQETMCEDEFDDSFQYDNDDCE